MTATCITVRMAYADAMQGATITSKPSAMPLAALRPGSRYCAVTKKRRIFIHAETGGVKCHSDAGLCPGFAPVRSSPILNIQLQAAAPSLSNSIECTIVGTSGALVREFYCSQSCRFKGLLR